MQIRKIVCFGLAVFSLAFLAYADPIKPARHFFPRAELMQIGAFYYPEQWPEEQWPRDFQNMAKFGFSFTHLGEFAWTFLEPEEGKFSFQWLDKAIDLASKNGLKVILCTPSPCPPAWMGKQYPEIYLVDSAGRRKEHGIRANASITNPRYNYFVDKIVTALAERYGKDTRIWGWQLDNEPLAFPDFSPSARQAFQDWLQSKYGSIAKLNEVWVGSFWSTRYDNFKQVLIPNSALNEEDKLSPHALLDFKRFTADATAAFLNRQADILRKKIKPEQWITTNYVNVSTDADPRRADRVDFPSFTMYPVRGQNELGGNSFRQGAPFRLAEACSYYRCIKGITGVMELQPGQTNWAATNAQVQPGAIHMWLMHAFGGQASFVCTYRYRHPLRGSEMYHDGIVELDGVTLSRGGRDFVQAIGEIKMLRANYDAQAVLPKKIAKRKTAFLWSHDVFWDLEIQKQSESWNTWQHRHTYAAAVKSTGAPMDFITENDDFSAYKFLMVPAYQLVNPALIYKWRAFAEKGGHLIFSCRTGQKDKNGHFFEANWAAPIVPLIGADIDFFDMLLPADTAKVNVGGTEFSWNSWGDVLSPKPGTQVLATYADQFYTGKAAAVSRPLGKGSVTYIGVETKDGKLERQLVRDVFRRAAVEIEDLPKGVYLEWRDGFFVGVNYADTPFTFSIPAGCRILVGANPVLPAQAVIWK